MPLSKRRERWQILREAFASQSNLADLPQNMPRNLRIVHFGADDVPFLICRRLSKTNDYAYAIRYALYGMFLARDAAVSQPQSRQQGR